MPKHSLFGSNMENVDKRELENTKGRYIAEGYIRPQKNRYPLPDHMQGALTGTVIYCRKEKLFYVFIFKNISMSTQFYLSIFFMIYSQVLHMHKL